MKIDLTPKEASIITYAIVHRDDLWKKEGNHYIPKDEIIEGILNKMNRVENEDEAEKFFRKPDSESL